MKIHNNPSSSSKLRAQQHSMTSTARYETTRRQDSSYLPEVRRHLLDALSSSENTEQDLIGVAEGADWGGDDEIRESLEEASRDTVEIDSSRFGESALEAASELQSLQSQLLDLSDSAGRTSDSTVQSLSNALSIARRAGAPDELQASIEDALDSAREADDQGEVPSEHLHSLSGNADGVADGAYEVTLDGTPGEWSGTDVSYHAEGALRYLELSKDDLTATRYSSSDAALEQRYTQSETKEALFILDAL